MAQSILDRRTSGSAPCCCGAEKWIERAADAEEQSKDDDDELVVVKHADADADDQRRRPTSSSSRSDSAAVVLPLVDATSEFLAVAVRGERPLLSEPAAIQERLSSAEEDARARLRIFDVELREIDLFQKSLVKKLRPRASGLSLFRS